MCLAIPGRVLERGPEPHDLARVEFGGIVKEVSLAYTPEAVVGDYVVVHAGFAISVLDAREAEESLAAWRAVALELEGAEGRS